VEKNIQKIQDEDIPRVESWAKGTGSRFAVKKTELIHLTRRKKELGRGQIMISGEVIKASSTAKLLSVVFDQEMKWKEHVQYAVKRATKVSTAMSSLRHLRPAQLS